MSEQIRITDTGRRVKQARTSADRFWAKVNLAGPVPAARPDLGPCWIWRGAKMSRGYGGLGANKQAWLAHRYSYTMAVGPIPAGLEIDHLCFVKLCVRPSHLEAVTSLVNNLRALHLRMLNGVGHCARGHAFAGDNLRLHTTRIGRRICRACNNDTQRRYRERLEATG